MIDLAPFVQKVGNTIHQASVVQRLDSTIHWINLYPVDSAILLVSPILISWIVVYPVDSAIQRFNNQGQINPNPVDSAIGFPNTFPLDRGFSSG